MEDILSIFLYSRKCDCFSIVELLIHYELDMFYCFTSLYVSSRASWLQYSNKCSVLLFYSILSQPMLHWRRALYADDLLLLSSSATTWRLCSDWQRILCLQYNGRRSDCIVIGQSYHCGLAPVVNHCSVGWLCEISWKYILSSILSLGCFGTVGWATGRASGL